MKRIAIIPARGGSKRIPEKNIKNFCGNPMISYPIKALIESKLFEKIHVSTNERKVVEVVNKIGLKVDFYRPESLSDDYTPIMPVVKYVIGEYRKKNENFDEIWVVLPCSPLINSKDLIKASIKFKQTNSLNSLMAVSEYPVLIEWAFKTNTNGVLEPLNGGFFSKRSQDLEKKYHDAGMFYIYSEEYVLNTRYNGSDQNIIPYLIPKGKSIDIDDIEDWRYAEKLFKSK